MQVVKSPSLEIFHSITGERLTHFGETLVVGALRPFGSSLALLLLYFRYKH